MDDKPRPYSDAEHTDEYYPEHQLIPQTGGRYTTILHGPPGMKVGDLACDLEAVQDGEARFVVSHSGWRPTPEHMAKLAAGAHVRLSVWQHPIPPLAVAVEPPVCECHGEEMEWVGTVGSDSGQYICLVNEDEERQPRSPFDQAKTEFKPEPVESKDTD